MPTYRYACRACGHELEEFHSMTAKPLKRCPKCGKSKLERLIGAGAGIIFKGSGFYSTDYRAPAPATDKATDEKASGEKASGEKTAAEKTAGEKTAGEKTASDKTAPNPPSTSGREVQKSNGSQSSGDGSGSNTPTRDRPGGKSSRKR